MALQYPKNLSLLLFVLFFTSLLQTQARQSKFFTKSIRYHLVKSHVPKIETQTPAPSASPPSPSPVSSIPELPTLTPELSPVPAPVEAESTSAPIEAEYGYGLYGQSGSREYSPETTSDENKIPATDEFAAENKFTTEVLSSKNYNGYPNNNYVNENGYTTSNNPDMNGYNGNVYTSSNNNERDGYGGDFNGNYGYTSSNNKEKNRYSERYDRNGNYFQNGYEPVRGNGNSYYGSNEDSKYEFNTMEEYERQVGYPQNQREEYTP